MIFNQLSKDIQSIAEDFHLISNDSNQEIGLIIQADCMDILHLIPSHSVKLILADLPYGITKNRWDSLIPLPPLWQQYERILAPNGNILLFGSGLFSFKLAISNEKMFRYDMIWKKSKCGSPLTAKYMPLKKHERILLFNNNEDFEDEECECHEDILVFGKPAADYNPQMSEGKPYARKWTPNKINNMQYGIEGVVTNNKGTRHPTTILDFPQNWRRQDQLHPTQKPKDLIKFLINSFSNEGDLVLDNVFGSGVTCVASKELGRPFLGIEKEKTYFQICKSQL
jgi:DNA modification methylase